MKFCTSDDLLGALVAEQIIEIMENRSLLQISDNNSVVCVGDDWQEFVGPLWISNEFIGAARIDRSADDSLHGRIKVFRVRDLTWQNENPEFDEHRAVAQVEFLLPKGFERTGDSLLVKSNGSVDEELTRSVLLDFVIQTRAQMNF